MGLARGRCSLSRAKWAPLQGHPVSGHVNEMRQFEKTPQSHEGLCVGVTGAVTQEELLCSARTGGVGVGCAGIALGSMFPAAVGLHGGLDRKWVSAAVGGVLC